MSGMDELADHYEEIAYADDIAEGQDWEVPEDYERHYCNEDGEDWPCATVRAATVEGHQVIPAQAVEAAAKAAAKDEDASNWYDEPEYYRNGWRNRMQVGLEAAAPHMLIHEQQGEK